MSAGFQNSSASDLSPTPPLKLVVLTSNRAEYYKLEPILKIIHESPELELFLIVSGSHLIYDYGYTIQYITYPIYAQVNTLIYGSNGKIMPESVGLAMMKYPQLLEQIQPDACILHGDRFDVLSMAMVSATMNIPIIHIEGGELSGTIDEKIRHSITKLSNFHIVSNSKAQKRVIQMGENPQTVLNFGCPVYDKLLNFKPNPQVLDNINARGISFPEKDYLICIFHPVTTDLEQTKQDFSLLLDLLERLDRNLLMFYPNVDTGSKELIKMIHQRGFQRNPKVVLAKSFDQPTYFSLLYYCAGMIGNSSSGIRETGAFGIPSLIIGSRQQGREQTENVTEIEDLHQLDQLEKLVQQEYGRRYEPVCLYGDGKFEEKFTQFIHTCRSWSVDKKFHDLE